MHRRVGARSAPYRLMHSFSRITHLRGFTLVELLTSLAIAALLITGLVGAIATTLDTQEHARGRNELTRQARFAMDRMGRAVGNTRRLLLPLADNPNTNWPENIREETVPPSPPIGDSTLATAVLAVTLPVYVDLDGDGFADADDDKDGLVDEDLANDNHHDFQPGIMLIDDDGDGDIDEGSGWAVDDEDGSNNEDPIDGIDNDGDNSVDEDPPSDSNGDGCPGVCGVDDDSDGTIDEGAVDDDDEDGGQFDDPYDPVVFYLDNGTLMERTPVPWNEDGISTPDGPVDGRDFIASAIAENATLFRVERVSPAAGQALLVDLKLELTSPTSGEIVSLHTQVRVGGTL